MKSFVLLSTHKGGLPLPDRKETTMEDHVSSVPQNFDNIMQSIYWKKY